MTPSQGVRVQAEDAGLRLDQFLAKRHPDLSRRRARVAIEIGAVFEQRFLGARGEVLVHGGEAVVAQA